MSHNPRIEEVSDSDSDPDIMDPTALVRATPSSSSSSAAPPRRAPTSPPEPPAPPASSKRWHMLYPLYFDAAATREGGRRVSAKLAVRCPLAHTVADAVARMGLANVFEPGKTHPRDWANPGRVRVRLRDEEGNWVAKQVKNSSLPPLTLRYICADEGIEHHLYRLVAAHLHAHPTTAESPLRLPVRGLPMPEGAPPAPPVPRGWRVGEVVPLHSPAASGGGVSDNIMRDFQAVMSGQDPAAVAGPSGAEGKEVKKKDKKKKK
jgi:signal recognition particle subunit SRP19